MTTNLWSALGDFTFSADCDAQFELRHDGKPVSKLDRKALLERLRAGEHIEIEFDAETYVQRDTPNAKHVRFKDSALKKVAASAKGSPFLRDHDTGSILSRGGTITASRADKNAKGEDVFIQTVRLTKPWAVEGALDGTIDRFSIGIRPRGPILYRHSGKEVKASNGWPEFFPGDKLENGTAVEWVFTDAVLPESSAVNTPAVEGTQIRGIREALSLALGKPPGGNPGALTDSGSMPHGETQMNGIKKILGLSDSAGEQEATAAIGKLQADLTVEKEKATEAGVELSKLQVKYEALSASQVDHEISAALADGRLKTSHGADGKRVPSKLETILRGQAEKFGAEVLRESLAGLEKLHGPPAVTQSQGTEPTQDPPSVASDRVGEALSTNPHLRKTMDQLGLSEDDLRAHGQLNTLPDLH